MKTTSTIAEVTHLLLEQQTEIERHHRDFEKIREIVHSALALDKCDFYDDDYSWKLEEALSSVRNIVG